jgi:hypothetical protein
VLEPGEEEVRLVRLSLSAALALTVLLAAAPALAAGGEGAKLAASLKKSLVATYKPGYTFTKVSCVVPTKTATKSSCNAAFTYPKQRLRGMFRIAVTIDRSTGGVRWKATSVSCTDLKSGAKVRC